MSEPRKKSDWLAVASLMDVLPLLLGLYVVGYFMLSDIESLGGTGVVHNGRIYDYKWQAFIFRPAAKVVSRFSYREVKTFNRKLPGGPNFFKAPTSRKASGQIE